MDEGKRDHHDELLAELVDRDMYQNEAMYHAQVTMFRRWLTMTERAMQDEGVDPSASRRVVHRIVYGAPDASDAYLRRQQHAERLQAARGPRHGTPTGD